MAYSSGGLFALQKGQIQVGSPVSEAEREQVVAFEDTAMPRSFYSTPLPLNPELLCTPALPYIKYW